MSEGDGRNNGKPPASSADADDSGASKKSEGKSKWDPWEVVPGRCNAKKADGSGLCRNYAGNRVPGMDRGPCSNHGGCTPTVKKHYQRERAIEAVRTYGLPRNISAQEALMEEVHRTAGAVAWLQGLIQRSDERDLVWGVSSEEAELIGAPGGARIPTSHKMKYEAAPSVWLKLYQWERKHLVSVSKAAIDAGIAQRVVELKAAEARMMYELSWRIISRLGIDPADPSVRQTVAAEFRDYAAAIEGLEQEGEA